MPISAPERTRSTLRIAPLSSAGTKNLLRDWFQDQSEGHREQRYLLRSRRIRHERDVLRFGLVSPITAGNPGAILLLVARLPAPYDTRAWLIMAWSTYELAAIG
jgi:hypothetical protein